MHTLDRRRLGRNVSALWHWVLLAPEVGHDPVATRTYHYRFFWRPLSVLCAILFVVLGLVVFPTGSEDTTWFSRAAMLIGEALFLGLLATIAYLARTAFTTYRFHADGLARRILWQRRFMPYDSILRAERHFSWEGQEVLVIESAQARFKVEQQLIRYQAFVEELGQHTSVKYEGADTLHLPLTLHLHRWSTLFFGVPICLCFGSYGARFISREWTTQPLVSAFMAFAALFWAALTVLVIVRWLRQPSRIEFQRTEIQVVRTFRTRRYALAEFHGMTLGDIDEEDEDTQDELDLHLGDDHIDISQFECRTPLPALYDFLHEAYELDESQ